LKIGIVGTGYVGLIQAVGLASFNYEVVGIDIDSSKIEKLKKGISPLYEEGLEDILKKHVNKNLIFSTDYSLLKDTDVIFLCVGTPQDKSGKANLSFLFSAVENLKKVLDKNKDYIIVTKSTVPVGTNRKIKDIFEGFNIKVVSNPEFLREGKSLYDFYNPDRIILGFEKEDDLFLKDMFINKIYKPFKEKNVPFVITNLETAELIKYASNAFLATKISFINEIAKLCDKVKANVKKVAEGMGLDPRIGKAFLNAGIGWGGSCFPKDVKALIKQFEDNNIEPILVKATDIVNKKQLDYFLEKIERYYKDLKNKTFAVLGLAFKPNTDDLRESRGIKLIEKLIEKGAKIKGFDYVEKARENARSYFSLKENLVYGYNIVILDNLYETVKNVDGIIITVEDDKFNKENWERISSLVNKKVIFDGRNILDKEKLEDLGFKYFGVGV